MHGCNFGDIPVIEIKKSAPNQHDSGMMHRT
jgi:hypothetical protein